MNSLHEALKQYIAVRRALGSKLQEPAMTLVRFVDLLEREGAEFITTELALRWAQESKGVQRATWARRLSMVRGFAAWMSAFDPRTEIPPRRLLDVRHRRPKPHIYTDQEVEQLMAEAARLSSPKGLRKLTYVTLIGLLAATGLRPGEALALDVPDVDLQTGILRIRQTKFGKSRFVPLEDSTRMALARYTAGRDDLFPRYQNAAFFISERGIRLNHYTARQTFAEISCAIGLRPPMEGTRIGRGPRLQDFRHTFATRKLVDWYQAGLDVAREMPKLTAYLGHVNVANTYWYIEAVPELLQLATEYCVARRQGGAR